MNSILKQFMAIPSVGKVSKLSKENSEKYFAVRPRESQLAAWASNQSEDLDSREDLEERYRVFEEKFDGVDVPCPENWGGYIVKPEYFEFWQGRENRMHDRIVYWFMDSEWMIKRLNP